MTLSCDVDAAYNCSKGTFKDTDGSCKACDDGCDYCNMTGTCNKCALDRLYLENTLTCKYFCRTKCVPGDRGCMECNDDSGGVDICAACMSNYIFNGFL